MMKFRHIFLISVLLMIVPCRVLAGSPDTIFRTMKDTSTFKIKMKEASKKFNTIEAVFSQYKSLHMLKTPAISEGYFCYKSGNLIRWEYKKPFAYIIIINKGKLFVKDEAKTSSYDLSSNKSFLEINNRITSIIDGSILDDRKDFQTRFLENDRQYLLEMKPVKGGMKDYFSSVMVYIDRRDMSVSALKMVEKSGDYTKIVFSDKKVNQNIPDEKFTIR